MIDGEWINTFGNYDDLIYDPITSTYGVPGPHIGASQFPRHLLSALCWSEVFDPRCSAFCNLDEVPAGSPVKNMKGLKYGFTIQS
jgi:hypothetical protein